MCLILFMLLKFIKIVFTSIIFGGIILCLVVARFENFVRTVGLCYILGDFRNSILEQDGLKYFACLENRIHIYSHTSICACLSVIYNSLSHCSSL